eukprot:11187634-Lingulodinium_polyedra.AAC.1
MLCSSFCPSHWCVGWEWGTRTHAVVWHLGWPCNYAAVALNRGTAKLLYCGTIASAIADSSAGLPELRNHIPIPRLRPLSTQPLPTCSSTSYPRPLLPAPFPV